MPCARKARTYGVPAPRDADKDVPGEDGVSYRDRLKLVGQKRRAQDPDYWVKKLARDTNGDRNRSIVITDVRFPNEIAWIREREGTVLWVRRAGCASDGAVSERDWSDVCDAILVNRMQGPAELAREFLRLALQVSGAPRRTSDWSDSGVGSARNGRVALPHARFA